MGCKCKVPPVPVPGNDQWGPLLWTILHGMAERAGIPSRIAEEVRNWEFLFQRLAKAIPCDVCRDHYKAYLGAHPPVLPTTAPELRAYLRLWWWELHENVNARTGKAAFPFADVESTYRGVGIAAANRQLRELAKRLASAGVVPLLSWNDFQTILLRLMGSYGVA